MEKCEKYVDLKSFLATQKEQLGNVDTFEKAEAYFRETAKSIEEALAKLENAALSELEKRYYMQVSGSCWESTHIAKSLSKSNCTVEQILDVLGDRREYIDRIIARADGIITGDEYLVAVIKYWENNLPSEMLKRLKDEVKNIAGLKNISDTSKGTLLTLLYSAIDSCSSQEACACYFELCLNIPEGLKTGKELGRHASRLWNAVYGNIKLEEEKRQAELAVAQERAANKVWRDVTHTIKNNISVIYGSLLDLEECTQEKNYLVQEALDATALIQSLASKTFYSMTGATGVWRCDVLNPEKKAKTLDIIIYEAIKHAISNMFVPMYYDEFIGNYFGDDYDLFVEAKDACKKADNLEKLKDVINRYFFDFTILTGDLKIPVGNVYDTRIRFFLLFNELFLNAIKHCSRIERNKRFLRFAVDASKEHWIFSWENPALKCGKDSGGGLQVISDIAKLFDVTPDYALKDGVYRTTLNFSLSKEE